MGNVNAAIAIQTASEAPVFISIDSTGILYFSSNAVKMLSVGYYNYLNGQKVGILWGDRDSLFYEWNI